ncbi:hypothetical protein GQ44DRAFT_672452 [Phaeosphaeriaceae sp. PMI808]|nr:hypothetical protein GQ44DRAFT_672452 [Phaeosphaeriaceae sp. PMI808]
MHFHTNLLPLFTIFTLATALSVERSLVARKDCDNHACISYYKDGGCTDGLKLGSYKPDCSGACFRYDQFSSILVSANVITGADCHAYSDGNCQNEIADSGNKHGQKCMTNLNGAKSMRCYYGC